MNDLKNYIEQSALIIDIGTGTTKAGLSGEENPCICLNSIYGIPKYKKILPTGFDETITISPEDNIKSIFKINNII